MGSKTTKLILLDSLLQERLELSIQDGQQKDSYQV